MSSPDVVLLCRQVQTYIDAHWEIVKAKTKSQALARGLADLIDAYDKSVLTDDVINTARVFLEEHNVVTCPCGHLDVDHDEEGCLFLGCRPICGKEEV